VVKESGVLYVVATPIGNLDDISARALQILRAAHLIAAEDTRHSGRLLAHFGIEKPLISLHEHNEQSRIPRILSELQAGNNIALISDAGTPLISDPGFLLLRSIRELGLKVIPIPGPSSVLAALSVAGLPTNRFAFEGFLPAKSQARRERLKLLKNSRYTMIFFESSHRIRASLEDMSELLSKNRKALLARELTKFFEQSHYADLAELCVWLREDDNRCKGEFVIVVEGADSLTAEQTELQEGEGILQILLDELPLKQAVKIAGKITGLNKNKLYELALSLKKN
jgi:16S rRNA (cytidine1402-2'-O)-methyltransferase